MDTVIEPTELAANGFVFSALAAGPADGRPVLLLHGFPQTSRAWRSTLELLAAAGYRAVAPDQRGYADGARPTDVAAYGIEHLVADALGMADALGWDRFDLVGHDWGGAVAWHVAARHPERLRSLTVVSTPHPMALGAAIAGDAEQRGKSGYMRYFQKPGEPERLLLGEDGKGDVLRAVYVGAVDPSSVDAYVDRLSRPGVLTAAINWYRAMARTDTDGMAAVVTPTLYVWSTDDQALGRTAAEATAEFVTGPYRFEVLQGVSHWIPEQAPDELSRLLLEHLATT